MGGADSFCWNPSSAFERGNRGREVSLMNVATGKQAATPTRGQRRGQDPAKTYSNDWEPPAKYRSRRAEGCGAAPTVDQWKQFVCKNSPKVHGLFARVRLAFSGNKSRGQARRDEEQETKLETPSPQRRGRYPIALPGRPNPPAETPPGEPARSTRTCAGKATSARRTSYRLLSAGDQSEVDGMTGQAPKCLAAVACAGNFHPKSAYYFVRK